MGVRSISFPSMPNTHSASSQRMEYSCQPVTFPLTSAPSWWITRPASLRRRREAGRKARRGKASMAGVNRMDGVWGERNVPAKKPWAGTFRLEPSSRSSRRESQFGAEAWKNQAACGKAGILPFLPPKPNEKPKGSFHKPKPQVPGMFAFETLACSRIVQGGACLKQLRRRLMVSSSWAKR